MNLLKLKSITTTESASMINIRYTSNSRQHRGKRLKAGFGISLVLSLALYSGQLLAQGAESPNWYQVEVIIFERLSESASGDPEIWPKNISLSYPRNWQKLIAPEQAEEMKARLEAQENLSDSTAPIDPLAIRSATRTRGQTATTEPEVPLPPIRNVGDEVEFAFVQLPAEERTLNESKGSVDRNRAMRVLFHEAWRQPALPVSQAPAIIVRGGNSYDEHMELEGSIKISISRYLHLHSNLWLTQFIPNYGQEPEHWPPLPPVPEYAAPNTSVSYEPRLGTLTNEDDALWEVESTTIDEYANLIEKPFLIKEIVTLEQTRRMRSGELHYVDHPRLGLLIKIDRYLPEKASKD